MDGVALLNMDGAGMVLLVKVDLPGPEILLSRLGFFVSTKRERYSNPSCHTVGFQNMVGVGAGLLSRATSFYLC